ncbi:NAD-dependent epimerase/dehydratase family protein [Pseudomonas putida]|uniref:NAD-dependent epimerase/dehydratase family protein n=1 Tax=Pseudomonas TaxID=286 RepID=UPI002363D56F|nr:NAD-dependent epimerase/dehydratase family protein [Pseudomonas putida]MDD2016998.1 NAD-dependent epimerase/dehydratase family protein [Pseudomonas putida]
MKSVMVTGASGFVGGSLCRELVRTGYSVVGVVRQIQQRVSSVEYFETDLVQEDSLAHNFPKVDCIIHLAGRAHVLDEKAEDPLAAFRKANRDATVRLASRALAAGVKRFVFVSSIGVNGNRTERAAFTEDSLPQPHAPYAISKREAEVELAAQLEGSGMELVIVRPPLIYAFDAPGNFGRLIRLAVKGVPLPLRHIENSRSLISRKNMVEFLKLCIEHPRAAGQVFLVADGQDISTAEMIKNLCKGMGKTPMLFPFPASLLRLALQFLGKSNIYDQLCGSLQVDASKARRLLGWRPEDTTPAALQEAGRQFIEQQKGAE